MYFQVLFSLGNYIQCYIFQDQRVTLWICVANELLYFASKLTAAWAAVRGALGFRKVIQQTQRSRRCQFETNWQAEEAFENRTQDVIIECRNPKKVDFQEISALVAVFLCKGRTINSPNPPPKCSSQEKVFCSRYLQNSLEGSVVPEIPVIACICH